ncbi:MAG TPA: hypothetical protein VNK41_09130 [Vicinamibacterales bacterium]|nr:hypothetical protein [Vicinamibacterales bacterium]
MRRAAFLAAAALLIAVPASAQPEDQDVFDRWTIEVDAGVLWRNGLPMGATRATLTGNQRGTPPVTFFETASRFEPSAGFEGRVSVFLSRVFAVEGAFRYARPRLETRISRDFEGAPNVTATQDVSHYAFEINGVAHLTRLRFGAGVPFIFGGGGYLRELYEGRQVAETGQVYQAGAGVKILFRQAPMSRLKGLGVRVDGRLLLRRGGVELDEDEPLRSSGAVAGGLMLVF